MFKVTVACLKFFAYLLFGIFLAFPISAMFGAIAFLFSLLPIIWEILWRMGLSLIMLTAIALFFEGLKKQNHNL